jgi:adenosylmethionine-8-amino-7-oxononanoate aminotransferase
MLEDRFGEHPHVGEVRGRGLFQGIELIADRASKQPFAPEHRLHARIKAEAMARGLLCYPAGGTIDGRRGDHVLLAPPFIVTDDDLDRIVDRLGQAVEGAIEQVSRAAA